MQTRHILSSLFCNSFIYFYYKYLSDPSGADLREALLKKKCFLSGIDQITSPPLPSPQFGQLVPLFLDVKNDVLGCITEPSNDDYDNDVSDNCDHNFCTFDDFGVKMTKKYHIT